MFVSRILRRHPLPMQARFEQVLVLTYAFPRACLSPLLPPGLSLDMYEDFGFLAIAMVQTRDMRPLHTPQSLGNDFFLTGYRVFARYQTAAGRTLRGLRILRSDTDSSTMVRWGNRLTHYAYRKVKVDYAADEHLIEVKIESPNGDADLHVRAYPSPSAAPLPSDSPFPDFRTARRFAGPLPFTFDYEPETHSIIRIQGVRKEWNPNTIKVEVLKNTFIDHEPFASERPILASAFQLANVSYHWKRGIRERLKP